MSPFPSLRGRVPLAITTTCILSVAAPLIWANARQAASSNDRAVIGVSSVGASTPGKGSLTPQAAMIAVNSLSDVANASDGLCTLREAITAANNNVASGAIAGECPAGTATGADTIDVTNMAGTITLISALPNINSDITLIGPGAAILTVRRNTAVGTPDFPIFFVGSGIVGITGLTVFGGAGTGIFNGSALTITNTTVTATQCVANGSISNGIDSFGPNFVLNVVNSTVSGNSCDHGAGYGIHLSGSVAGQGVATITNSVITGNNSSDPVNPGGGIESDGSGGSGLVSIKNSIVAGNMGPGVKSGGGVLSITDTTIRDNVGGGLSVFGQVTVVSSTISGNTALSAGGIINFATLTLLNSTISGNKTTGGPGGGIFNRAQVTAVNCTIANNTAATVGGGIYNERLQSRLVSFNLRNTIIANNQAGSGTWFDVGGPDAVVSQDYNLIGNNAGSSIAGVTTHNIVNVDPKLGPLADNGGATMTHALLQNSPALDAGDNCVTDVAHCGDSTIPQFNADQRSFSRMIDGPDADPTATVDIGAYEAQPVLANLADVTTNEDSQRLVGFDAGDPSTITSFTATSSNTTLLPNDAAHLTTGIHGTTAVITINPATNQFGTTNITVNLSRTGGSETKTFLLTVTSVNDAPSFQLVGPDQIINEDAPPQTINNFAANIAAGPADESGQSVTFQVIGNTNSSLFSSGPTMSATGTLTYTTAANANGSATVTINLKDNGGTANGGTDTSALQSFTITVNSVNDVPSFTKGADQTVNNNSFVNVSNWATNISSGPANESSQTITFQITSNTNSALFSSGPAISSAGTLTCTPSSSAGGTATITIVAKDNGGTANGGVDTSPPQSFTITVIPVGGFVSFASTTANTTENAGSTTVNVVRTGDTSRAITVNYATNGDSGLPCSTATGIASPKCDFTAAVGTLSFAAGETSKPITILISQDSFVEGPEAITLTLSAPTNFAALGTPVTMAVTIADDATEPPTNIIDDPSTFVRMHYHDFLNREPDQSGLDFWTGQMTNCGNSDLTVCRVNVSGAFFLSIEFQQTGYLVERMYKTAYGDATGASQIGGSHQILVPVVRANEFLTDTQRVGRGVIVNTPGWETVLENNKQAYALEFVQTSRFFVALPTFMRPSQFVDKLNTNAGNVLSPTERTTAINLFGGAGDTTNITARAQALRQVAENQNLYNAEFRRAFVLTQYIGYLRRNPNDLPDSDYTGFEFWLTKLNQFNGDYIAAEMVKAFISSAEYRQRFGP